MSTSMLENRFNQIMFEFNIARSATLQRSYLKNPQFVLELMDRIYNGQDNPDYVNHDYIKKLSDINYINLNMRRSIGSIISTTELTESIVSNLETNKDQSPEAQDASDKTNNDKMNDLIKIFTSREFADKVDASNEAQDQVDSLFSCAGDSELSESLSKEEIDIRNSIIKNLKSKNYRTNLKTIMDCFGYFYSFANKIKKETFTSLRVSPTSVEMGNDISRALPSELGFLDSEELLPVFAKKMINREILQFKFEGKENQGKGSVVLGLDISDSMNDVMKNSPVPGASKMNVAIGFCLTIAKIMRDQGRQFHFFTFNTMIKESYSSLVKPFHRLLHDIMNTAIGGGTDLEVAVGHGINCYDNKTDFIMVSDCEGDITKPFSECLQLVKKKRFATLVLESRTDFSRAYGYGATSYTNLKGLCDSFIVNDGADGFKHEIEAAIK